MTASDTQNTLLRLVFPHTAVLRACYMPFLQHKGLFVPSLKSRELGERLFLVLRLPCQNLTVSGMVSVCWITPRHSSDGREPGFGLHFDENACELRAAVESVVGADSIDQQTLVSYTL